jgi:hypothetical protein
MVARIASFRATRTYPGARAPRLILAMFAVASAWDSYYPENPYYCDGGPYYDAYCASSVGGLGVKKFVGLKLSKHCRKKAFSFRPWYSGGTVLWTKVLVGKKKIKKLTVAPFKFTIPIKKLKKGKKYKIKLTTIFTDGTPVLLNASFTRCK